MANLKPTALKGRRQLFTNYLPPRMIPRDKEGMLDPNFPVLNEDSVPKIIGDLWGDIQQNGMEIEYLLNYYRGEQDILERKKEVRPDVDNRIVFNHAMALTRNIVAYTFGKPIRYVHRTSESRDKVAELNDMVETEDKFASDHELGTNSSICGTAYRGVFTDTYGVEDDIPFSLVTLDPRSTFVVYSSEIGHAPVLAGSFYTTPATKEVNAKTVYIIYTHDYVYRYETESEIGDISPSDLVGEPYLNLSNMIPIVEYPNNPFRIGDWEMAKTLLDAINIIGSDSVNDLVQFVNSILVATNVDITPEHITQLKDDKFIGIRSDKELPAELKYITEQLDSGNAESLRTWVMEQLQWIVGVPSRDSRAGGGGDTGDAVYLRDGFQDLEIVARTKESSFKRAERTTLRLILRLLDVHGELKGLVPKDIDIRFSRNMTDGILSKSNAISILHSTQILDPVDTLSIVGITTEPDDLSRRGEEYWKDKRQAPTDSANTRLDLEDEILKQKVDRI